MVENAQLKKDLQDLRNELQILRKEMESLRKNVPRRQSASPQPPKTSERRSRSRVSRQKLNAPQSTPGTLTYITEQTLVQREAKLKFESAKEWQKAFSGISVLQDQFNLLKEEIQRVFQQIQQPSPQETPEEAKRKKKNPR